QLDANPRTRPTTLSRGGKTNIAQSRQQQTPLSAATSSSVRTGGFRAKIPIVRHPAFMRSALIGPLVAPQRPNAPFRPPQSRPRTQFNHGAANASSSVPTQDMVSKETMSK
ncbi:hypothetical protein PIB30_100376, partial [Stylosanthes scabra]|nr:hypothetical protein [Stylosanthes scabra]